MGNNITRSMNPTEPNRGISKMKQDLFANLPSEIIIYIFAILPFRSIGSCKCVCKSWLNLLESQEFVNFHIFKSIPGLALHAYKTKLLENFEFVNGVYKSVHKCSFPLSGWVLGSVNGLLLLKSLRISHYGLLWLKNKSQYSFYICNPVTRDYVELPSPNPLEVDDFFTGFGASKISGQHKVVMVLKEYEFYYYSYVYTIGTGLWRRVAGPGTRLTFCGCNRIAPFLNGNLHWLVVQDSKVCICWVDLETERYSTFSLPVKRTDPYSVELCVFQGTLCLCDNEFESKSDVWLMKEYGVEKSWTKQYSIPNMGFDRPLECLIKQFKGGDMLFASKCSLLFYYKKTNKVKKKPDGMFERFYFERSKFEGYDAVTPYVFTPSFLSLKSFEKENARSL